MAKNETVLQPDTDYSCGVIIWLVNPAEQNYSIPDLTYVPNIHILYIDLNLNIR